MGGHNLKGVKMKKDYFVETVRKYSDGSICKGFYVASTRDKASAIALELYFSGEWDSVEIYSPYGRCIARYSHR